MKNKLTGTLLSAVVLALMSMKHSLVWAGWSEVTTPPLPPIDEIYTPKPELTGAHPRLYFPEKSLAEIQKSASDPRYAVWWTLVRKDADVFAKETLPDLQFDSFIREPPNKLPVMALAYLVEKDESKKKEYRDGIKKWLALVRKAGPAKLELVLSHGMIGVSLIYDWLHDDPEFREELAPMREYLVACARWLLDPANSSAAQWWWREYASNHTHLNYGGLAHVAAALAGESGPLAKTPEAAVWGATLAAQTPGGLLAPLRTAEPKAWMDRAMQEYYHAFHCLPADGVYIEGITYFAYATQGFLGMDLIQEHLLNTKFSLADSEFAKHCARANLMISIPGNNGFLDFGDSHQNTFGGSSWLFKLASKYKDPLAQSLGTMMLAKDEKKDWHGLFTFDPSQAKADPKMFPTAWNESADGQGSGLYLTRSSWSDAQQILFAVKCGPLMGESTFRYTQGTDGNGHLQPDCGNVSYYYGKHAVLPAFEYGKLRDAANHNLILIDSEDGKTKLGQIGGGGQWFDSNLYLSNNGHGKVIAKTITPEYSTYLLDLSNVYRIPDSRAPKGIIYPTYRRSVTYFVNGTVVIADRIETPFPRSFNFRLLTGAKDLKLNGKKFSFSVGNPKANDGPFAGKIWDASPRETERSVQSGVMLSSYAGLKTRDVVSLRQADTRSAVFVVILGMQGSEKDMQVTADESRVVIQGGPAGKLVLPITSLPLRSE
jgi:hypothetical protein